MVKGLRFIGLLLILSLPALAEPGGRNTGRGAGLGAHCTGEGAGPWRFGRLNLLAGEIMLLHIDAYPPPRGPASESCLVRIAFVSEVDVLQAGDFTLTADRGLDVAFPGPTSGVVQVKPVITPYGRCRLGIVPLVQVQEQLPAGTGKTLYLYTGQRTVPLTDCGDPGSASGITE